MEAKELKGKKVEATELTVGKESKSVIPEVKVEKSQPKSVVISKKNVDNEPPPKQVEKVVEVEVKSIEPKPEKEDEKTPSKDESKEVKMDTEVATPEDKIEVIDKSSLSYRMKSKLKKLFVGCLSLLLLVVLLLALGAYGGSKLKPQIEEWLVDRLGLEVTTDSNGETVVKSIVEITSEESNVIQIVEENMDSVVSVAVKNLTFSPNGGIVDSSNNIGSGFVVDESGLVVTNQHVVDNDSVEYEIVTSTGKKYDVKKIIRDEQNDIALLEVELVGDKLNAVKLGDSDALLQGQMVVAIGTPLGEYAGSVTTGVVSGLNRSVTTGSTSFFGSSKTFEDVIQTDAAVNPGNSGGPLLSSSGVVIGVNFATSSGADNISFALPINRVKTRISEYRKFGKFVKPYIGVEYQLVSEAEAQYFDELVPGALVRRVVSDGPADDAGVMRGDIITKIGDEDVKGAFVSILQGYSVGDKVVLQIYRDGEVLELEVILGEVE